MSVIINCQKNRCSLGKVKLLLKGKSLLYFLLTLFAVSGSLSAATPQEDFKTGNRFYQQGKYEQAAARYQAVLDAGYTSGALYFNLGNVYYKLDQPGLSRLNYERAALILKNDGDLADNILLLKQKLVDKIPQPPRFFLNEWKDFLLGLFSIQLLTWLSAALFALLLLSAALRRHALNRGRGRRFRTLFTVSAVLFIVVALLYGQKIYHLETETYGVILQPVVTVFAEPSALGTEVFVLHEGTKVKIERTSNDWLEIKLADGKTGWLTQKSLETI